MSKDYNKIAKYEKAIKDKYGDDAIQNPKKLWDEEKEKSYLKDLKKFHKKENVEKQRNAKDGFDVIQKKEIVSSPRNCPVCGDYSVSTRDDLYMVKFECCFNCYVQHVEHREERWNSGWRPNK